MASAAPYPNRARPPQHPAGYPWPPPANFGPVHPGMPKYPGQGPMPPAGHPGQWGGDPRYQQAAQGAVPWYPPKGPKPPPPGYYGVELQDNPLGLSNMHIRNDPPTEGVNQGSSTATARTDDYVRRTGATNPRALQKEPTRDDWGLAYSAATWDQPLPRPSHAQQPGSESNSSSSSETEDSEDIYSDDDDLQEQYLRGMHTRERQRDRSRYKDERRTQPDHVRARELQREKEQREREQRDRERERERENQRQATHAAEVARQATGPLRTVPPASGDSTRLVQISPYRRTEPAVHGDHTQPTPPTVLVPPATTTTTPTTPAGGWATTPGNSQTATWTPLTNATSTANTPNRTTSTGETFTEVKTLQPTFSPRIVRTPTHYEQKKRLSTPPSGLQPPLPTASSTRHPTLPSAYSHGRSPSESPTDSHDSPPRNPNQSSPYGSGNVTQGSQNEPHSNYRSSDERTNTGYTPTTSALGRSATMPVLDSTPSRSSTSKPTRSGSIYTQPPQRSQTAANAYATTRSTYANYGEPEQSSPSYKSGSTDSSPSKRGPHVVSQVTEEPESSESDFFRPVPEARVPTSALGRSATMPDPDPSATRASSSNPIRGSSVYAQPPQRHQTVAALPTSRVPQRSRTVGVTGSSTSPSAKSSYSVYAEPQRTSPTFAEGGSDSSPSSGGHNRSSSRSRPSISSHSSHVPQHSNMTPVYSSQPVTSNHHRSSSRSRTMPSDSSRAPSHSSSSYPGAPIPSAPYSTSQYTTPPSSHSQSYGTSVRTPEGLVASRQAHSSSAAPYTQPVTTQSHTSARSPEALAASKQPYSSSTAHYGQAPSTQLYARNSATGVSEPSYSSSTGQYAQAPSTQSASHISSARMPGAPATSKQAYSGSTAQYTQPAPTQSHSRNGSTRSAEASTTTKSSHNPASASYSTAQYTTSSQNQANTGSARTPEALAHYQSITNPLPTPPGNSRYEGRHDSRHEQRQESRPHASRRQEPQDPVRRGYWNSRGDHLTDNRQIVFVPNDKANPTELRGYPKPTEGFRDHRGIFIPYDPKWPELKLSPGRDYLSLIKY